LRLILRSAFEAPAVVSGLDDIAVVRQAIEERGRHFGVCEDTGPFSKGQVGGDDDRGALVKPADEVEQELAAGLCERQIAEFIEDDEVHAGQVIGKPTLTNIAGFGFEPIDEIDDVMEAAACAIADAATRDGNGEMGLAGAGPADQHGIALLGNDNRVVQASCSAPRPELCRSKDDPGARKSARRLLSFRSTSQAFRACVALERVLLSMIDCSPRQRLVASAGLRW